jgi:hypothetical protein
MKITISTSSMDTFKYDIDETTTIYSLKELIHREKSGYPIQCMKLVSDDILLHNDAHPHDYGINDESNIRLVISSIITDMNEIDPQLYNWCYDKN